jgi:threonine synthase
MKMGLPVSKFIIATNENDEFPSYLKTGIYSKIEPSKNCISSAMNVGHPSNLARLIDLYGGIMDEKGNILKEANRETMQKDLWSAPFTDDQTRKTIKEAYDTWKVILEPHGAVGWAGLLKYLETNPPTDLTTAPLSATDPLCVSLETAHPAKFPGEIMKILSIDPELPPSLKGLSDKPEKFKEISNNYIDFKKYLRETFQ